MVTISKTIRHMTPIEIMKSMLIMSVKILAMIISKKTGDSLGRPLHKLQRNIHYRELVPIISRHGIAVFVFFCNRDLILG